MSPSAGGFSGTSSEVIQHFGAVKLRITGSGNLDSQFLSLDGALTQSLTPIAMSVNSGREPRILANFITERARLEISTDQIDEYFNINRMLIFVRPIWTEYPG